MDNGLDLDGLFKHNGTFDYGDYEYKEDCIRGSPSFVAIFICILYFVAVMMGLLGNILVLVVLWQKRQSWSVTDGFVIHLSIADMLLLFTMPLWAVDAVVAWPFNTEICKLAGALFKINHCCSIFLLVCISLDLYFYTIHTMKMFSSTKLRLVQLSCLAFWFLCFLLSIPDWIYLTASIESEHENIIECVYRYPSESSRLVSRLCYHVLGFLLPAIVLIYCCTHVLLQCRSDQIVQKRRAVRVIFVLVLAFLISWIPYNIALLMDTFYFSSSKLIGQDCEHHRWTAVKITAVLGFLHSCFNPLIYFSFSEKFRHWVVTIMTFGSCAVNSGDFFSLDSRETNRPTSVPQEENGSLHPMSDIKETITQQQSNKIL